MPDVSEGDGVLLSSQEALGSIDRIECPVTVGCAIVVARIDGIHDIMFACLRSPLLDGCDDGVANVCLLVASQFICLLFANDEPIVGLAVFGQNHRDDRLRRIVGHGDRAAIILDVLRDISSGGLHGAGQGGCCGDRIESGWKQGVGCHGVAIIGYGRPMWPKGISPRHLAPSRQSPLCTRRQRLPSCHRSS